jgi:hypothetical protein
MEQFVNMLMVALLSSSPGGTAKPMVLIDNWPSLRITEHLVGTMPAACNPNSTGCAVVNFSDRTCDVYVAWREPQKATVRERQLKRCKGYDEAPFRLRTAYAQWRAIKPCKPRKDGEPSALVVAAVD